jgi:hypothetical protein
MQDRSILFDFLLLPFYFFSVQAAVRLSTFADRRHDAGDSKIAATNAAAILLTFYFCLFTFSPCRAVSF